MFLYSQIGFVNCRFPCQLYSSVIRLNVLIYHSKNDEYRTSKIILQTNCDIYGNILIYIEDTCRIKWNSVNSLYYERAISNDYSWLIFLVFVTTKCRINLVQADFQSNEMLQTLLEEISRFMQHRVFLFYLKTFVAFLLNVALRDRYVIPYRETLKPTLQLNTHRHST